jgi:hypothetical protein
MIAVIRFYLRTWSELTYPRFTTNYQLVICQT